MATKLGSDETYMKKYDQLSPAEQKAADATKAARIKAAQDEVESGDSIGQRVSDVAGRLVRSFGGSSASAQQQAADEAAAKRTATRQSKLDAAQAPAGRNARYVSETPGKAADNFKRGGRVKKMATGGAVKATAQRATGYRGYGIAKKV